MTGAWPPRLTREQVAAWVERCRREIRPAPEPRDAPKTGLSGDLSHEPPQTAPGVPPEGLLGPQNGAQRPTNAPEADETTPHTAAREAE